MTQPIIRKCLTWNGNSLLLTCFYGEHWAKSTVPIVSASSSIQLSILNHSLCGPLVSVPSSIQHMRLFIKMTIKENGTVFNITFNFSKQYWSVSFVFNYFAFCALNVQRVNVWLDVLGCFFKESISGPLWIKTFRCVWDLNELRQFWNHNIVEHCVNVLLAFLGIELCWHFGYFCYEN